MIAAVPTGFFFNLDLILLKFFNTTLANPLFDAIMPTITSIDFWRWPIIIALAGIAVFGGRYGLVTVVLGFALLTLTDQLSSSVLKELFGRLRPCHEQLDIRILSTCGHTKSFPSSHATNTMAAAIFFGFRYQRIRWELLALALLVSYSRVYLGIHYPADLLAGWCLGGGCAVLILRAYRPLQQRWPAIERTRHPAWLQRFARVRANNRKT